MTNHDRELIAHLMRRGGFGATREEIEQYAAQGYDATVDMLLGTDRPDGIQMDLLRRYHPDYSGGLGMAGFAAYWLHRMINSRTPLVEKAALFWHGVFATGYAKLAQGKVLMDQIQTFREYGFGGLPRLLVELSKDPSMIIWLDNNDNHNGAVNENYGRELLELFSMGVGNYTEDDVQEASRTFTGWTVGNTEYMKLKADNDSLWPYGRLNLHFEFRGDDHDDGVIRFLGHTGHMSGEDVVDVICSQLATARFIARHMYSFFVADEPPVPSWPYTPPRDSAAIDEMAESYFKGGYCIKTMFETMFRSDFFKSEDVWYERVKSPAELVAGVLRLTGKHRAFTPAIQQDADAMGLMGQTLVNPPSVEGWHWGDEWIDTGNLVERVNFASSQFMDAGASGIVDMIDGFIAETGGSASPPQLVDACLDQMGAIRITDASRMSLIEHAAREGDLEVNGGDSGHRRIAEMVQLIGSTPEFQRG